MGFVKKIADDIANYDDGINVDVPDDYMARLNYVFLEHSSICNGSLSVYVYTFIPAVLNLFIELRDFSRDDVIRWIFRPRGSRRRGGHGRRGSKKWVPRSGVYRNLPDRHVTNGVRNLWRVDGVGQRILLSWLVVDATTEFAYTWTTLLHESGGCEYGHALADAPNQTLITLGGWSGGHFGTVISAGAPMTISGTGATCGGLDTEINCNVQIKGGAGPGPTTVAIRIVAFGSSGQEVFEANTIVEPDKDASLWVSGNVKGCTSAGADMKTNGFAVTVTHGSFHCVGDSDWAP